MYSPDAQGLLQKSFGYLSALLTQIVRARFLYTSLACGALALLHLVAEWLYLGRPVRRFPLWLLCILLAAVLLGGSWLQPRLKSLHTTRFLGPTAAERQAAQNSLGFWQTLAHAVDLLTIGGLAVYLWAMANPPDTLRFVSPGKFRS